jgi:FkbO/Hyg5 family chorismatase
MTQTQLVDVGRDLGYVLGTTLVGLDRADDFPGRGNVLGRINYTTAAADPVIAPAGHPVLDVHMTRETDGAFSELWTTHGEVMAGKHDGVAFAHDGEFLFLAGRIPEGDGYAAATERAYLTTLGLIRELGYPRCYRMWNFVSRINEDNADGLENYRDFCLGRANAFEKVRFNETDIPAATGIGSLGGGVAFYVLSSRSGTPIAIENPQQMSAYHYPKRYGPKAPKFARATHLGPPAAGQGAHVYVSGTASITGHESLHAGDVVRQTHLALENIARVIGASNLWEHGVGDGYFLSSLNHIKVYVRHAADIETVRRICEQAFSPAAEIRYLNVDVCRSDLLVEIEGIAY